MCELRRMSWTVDLGDRMPSEEELVNASWEPGRRRVEGGGQRREASERWPGGGRERRGSMSEGKDEQPQPLSPSRFFRPQ